MAGDVVSSDVHPRRTPFWYFPPSESPGIVLGVIYALPVKALAEVRGGLRGCPKGSHPSNAIRETTGHTVESLSARPMRPNMQQAGEALSRRRQISDRQHLLMGKEDLSNPSPHQRAVSCQEGGEYSALAYCVLPMKKGACKSCLPQEDGLRAPHASSAIWQPVRIVLVSPHASAILCQTILHQQHSAPHGTLCQPPNVSMAQLIQEQFEIVLGLPLLESLFYRWRLLSPLTLVGGHAVDIVRRGNDVRRQEDQQVCLTLRGGSLLEGPAKKRNIA